MVTCEWSVSETGDATLVQAVLVPAGTTPRRVTVAARVDGAVWQPRRNGVPEREWADGELTTMVPPNDRVAVGFATPAEPTDPPIEVVEDERADEQSVDANGLVPEASADGVVRALGDGRPPRDAVPEPAVADANATSTAEATDDGSDDDGSDDDAADADGPGNRDSGSGTVASEGDDGTRASSRLPGQVEAWFAAVERRLADEPQRAVADEPQRAVADERETPPLAGEAVALRAVAHRASELAVRCERRDGNRPFWSEMGDGPRPDGDRPGPSPPREP